jgi:hypothetical protein
MMFTAKRRLVASEFVSQGVPAFKAKTRAVGFYIHILEYAQPPIPPDRLRRGYAREFRWYVP